MPNGNSIKERLTALEVMVNEIAKNHLPHLETKMDRMSWLLVTTLVSALIGVALIIAK